MIMENRGVVGSILAWLGTAWAVFESHYGAIAALFAIAVSIVTMWDRIKSRREKTRKDQP